MANQDRSGQLRVATLNLWGRQGDWQARRKVMVDGFRDLELDLVAFQEVITTADSDQAADILGPDYQIVHQSVGLIEDSHHIAIGSRWPVGEVHEVDLNLTPRTADFQCATLIAEIEAPEPVGRLLFVNHLPNYELNFEYEREIQTVAVARVIEELVVRQPMHVVLAGDLDADPAAASIRFLSGRQSLDGMSVCYRNAWESAHPGKPAETFIPENPLINPNKVDWPFRWIDHIFVRCETDAGGPTLHITDCNRIFDQPRDGVWASDHFGVMADLAVPEGGGA
jgi:endonuclease/exonuclease/phosphatase family metal-dependent hydrolase